MQDKKEARPSPDPGIDLGELTQSREVKPPDSPDIDLNDENNDKEAWDKKELEAKKQAEEEAKKQAQAKAEAEAKTQTEAKTNPEKETQDRLAQKMKSASTGSASPAPEPAKPAKGKNPFASAYQLVKGTLDPKDAEKLAKAFDEEIGEGSRRGNTMYFSSREEASAFFKEQAKDKSFLVREQGRDYYMYSDGMGDFFQGTKAELEVYMNDKKEAKKDKAEDKALDSGKDETKEQDQEHKQEQKQKEDPQPEPEYETPAPK